MQKMLITVGLLIASIGVLYPYLKRIGLGRLPGDIIIRSENSSFYFPVVSCIAISLLLTVIFNLFRTS